MDADRFSREAQSHTSGIFDLFCTIHRREWYFRTSLGYYGTSLKTMFSLSLLGLIFPWRCLGLRGLLIPIDNLGLTCHVFGLDL